MMPFMMGPVLYKMMDRSGESSLSKTLPDLVQTGVNALYAERGTYDHLLVGETTVTGNLVPDRKFRRILQVWLTAKHL